MAEAEVEVEVDDGRWTVDGWKTLLGEEWIGDGWAAGLRSGNYVLCTEHRVEYYYSYAPYRRTQTSRTQRPSKQPTLDWEPIPSDHFLTASDGFGWGGKDAEGWSYLLFCGLVADG
jgi:hypothetical protein